MTTIAAPKKKKDDEPQLWSHSLFDCCGDPRLGIWTFLLPCYTLGRNSEAFGEDGGQVGLWCGLCCFGIAPIMRWRVRQEYNIKGNMITDAAVSMLCPCCAIIQENKQIYGLKGSHVGEVVEEKLGERTPIKDSVMSRQ